MANRYRILAIASPALIIAISTSVPVSWAGIVFAQVTSPNTAPLIPANSSIPSTPTVENSTEAPGNQLIPAKYFIGPGDQLQVTVFGYPEYTGTQVVLSDGTISLPVIGSIKAINKTPAELAQLLTTTLNNYLVNPVVSVSISNVRPITVNVAGQVQRPGPVQLRSVTAITNSSSSSSQTNAGFLSLQAPTIVAALLEAGGVSRDGDIRRIVVKRFSPTGDSTPFTLNLWNSLISENATPALILQDGDSVFIPKLAAGDMLDRRLIARSSFAPKTVRVRVVGEVKKPGELDVAPTSSLSGAIAIAGGPTDKANLGKVTFVRLNDQGRIEQKTLNLNNLSDTNQVQEGDVLIVPKRFGWTALDVASPLVTPFNFLLNILEAAKVIK